jgi:hypothetical protein
MSFLQKGGSCHEWIVESGRLYCRVQAVQPVADLAKSPTVVVNGYNNNGIAPGYDSQEVPCQRFWRARPVTEQHK